MHSDQSVAIMRFGSLLTAILSDDRIKTTSLTPGQRETSTVLWVSADRTIEVGVWEATPGEFLSDFHDREEWCYFLAGSLELHPEFGTVVAASEGDLVLIPLGWTGSWRLRTTVRKLYITMFKQLG